MGFEADEETEMAATLPLFSVKTHIFSIDSSPLHTLASVPFCWEDAPGRPKHSIKTCSTDLITNKGLELPPRLLCAKLPSSASNFGSHNMVRRRKPESSSLRMIVMGRECYGSFRRSCGTEKFYAEEQQLGAPFCARNWERRGDMGVMGPWKTKFTSKENTEIGGASYVFPSAADIDGENTMEWKETSATDLETTVKITRNSKTGSPDGRSHKQPRFWASFFNGLKQVIPRRSKKVVEFGL